VATTELTLDNFGSMVKDNDIVFVDFWASWCPPCRAFAPVYEGASEEHTDIVFGSVNTEEQQQLAGQFGISSIPTLMIFRENVLLFQQAGALREQDLEQLIGKVRELDMTEVHAEVAKQKEAAK